MPRRKVIAKPAKTLKPQMSEFEAEGRCVRRIHDVLRIFGADGESARRISVSVVLKLKSMFGLCSPQFQKQFLAFIEWLRAHSQDPEFVKAHYEKFL